jgi:tRNA(Arg) A34 adenosine deaminase TadA
MISETEKKFLERAVQLSRQGMQSTTGGPFGCVVVKDGEIIGEGCNMVTSTSDPTAHAEVVAIRAACRKLGTYQLEGCTIYTSCEPCPMCLGAIYWARPAKVVYANTRYDAAGIDFDDEFIYAEMGVDIATRKIPFIHVPMADAEKVFHEWQAMEGKTKY